jgi:3-oxoacyl-[acyl-carrier-protein] synthase II
VLGEGAGVVVLESEEHARARGARIYCTLAGAGMSADSHHVAQPDPSGTGVARALRFAIADGKVDPADIVHVNAHATSTPQGDVAEVLALRAVLGDAADGIVVTGTKSMTGHLLGGAGALESVITVLSLREGLVPATANLDDLDDAVDLDIVRGEPRTLPDGPIAALNNSFGFGGHNTAVVFQRAV